MLTGTRVSLTKLAARSSTRRYPRPLPRNAENRKRRRLSSERLHTVAVTPGPRCGNPSRSQRLPVGVQLVGPELGDNRIVGIAEAIDEQVVFEHRQLPLR